MKLPKSSELQSLEQQIAFIVRQTEKGSSVEEVCRKAGISIQTYYRWRKKLGKLLPPELRRLELLEEENLHLRRVVADLSLTKNLLQEVVRSKRICLPTLEG